MAWPRCAAALTTEGFATELRDLMSRCTERGVDPAAAAAHRPALGRPEWSAAGQFAQPYEQIMLLRRRSGWRRPGHVPALGAAELVGAALEAFAADPELLAGEHGRIRLLLVDDAQNWIPKPPGWSGAGRGVERTIIAGDPNQSVFGYPRGRRPLLREEGDDGAVKLTQSHRCAPVLREAVSGVGRLLPGRPGAHLAGADGPAGSGGGASLLPHTPNRRGGRRVRRAHLVDGVPWSQMAVIVRSVPRAGAGLPRALTAAGVPWEPPAWRAAGRKRSCGRC